MIDPDKDLDLHESEWSKKGSKPPILGPNGGWFFLYVIPMLILGLVFHEIFSFLFIDVLGMPTGR